MNDDETDRVCREGPVPDPECGHCNDTKIDPDKRDHTCTECSGGLDMQEQRVADAYAAIDDRRDDLETAEAPEPAAAFPSWPAVLLPDGPDVVHNEWLDSHVNRLVEVQTGDMASFLGSDREIDAGENVTFPAGSLGFRAYGTVALFGTETSLVMVRDPRRPM